MEPRQQLATSAAKVPARDTVATKWFVRVDGAKEFLRQKCGELGSKIDTEQIHALYHEGGTKENPHCHFLFTLKAPVKKQALSVRIKTLFGVKGAQYSLNNWDGELNGAGSYLYHEDADDHPIASKGFTDEDIKAMQTFAGEWRKVVERNKKKASIKLVDKALDHFKDQTPAERDVFIYLLACCATGENHYPGGYTLKKYTEEVMLKLSNASFDEYSEKLYERMFRN